MKKAITILILILQIISVQAQNKMFADRYLKVRQSTENEGFQLMKYNQKDIRKLMADFESQNHTEKERKEYLEGKTFFEKAQLVVVIADINIDDFPPSKPIHRLLESYEDLASMEVGEVKVAIRGSMRKDKVKELIFSFDMEEEFLFYINVLFEKPLAWEDYMKKPMHITQLINFNSSGEEENKGFININYSKKFNVESPEFNTSVPFTLEIIKVNDKYGVKSSIQDDDKYVIKPQHDNIVLYGSNPGNTYIKTLSDHESNHILHDKFGFTVSWGDEITPIYIPGSEEVACFIIRRDDLYALYECPEKYELIQEGSFENHNLSFRPHIEFRIMDCASITLTASGLLECVKPDGSAELITIDRLKE